MLLTVTRQINWLNNEAKSKSAPLKDKKLHKLESQI